MLKLDTLGLHQAVLNDDLKSVKNFIDYPGDNNIREVCKKIFIDCLISYSVDAAQAASSQIEFTPDPEKKIRYQIAELLIQSSNIDLNTEVSFVYNGKKYVSSPFDIAFNRLNTDMIHFLLFQPTFQASIFHLEKLISKLGKFYADNINRCLINLIRLCEIKVIQHFIHYRQSNPNQQTGPINKWFGGIDKDYKISAAEFLLANIQNILSIESLSEYNIHKNALNQGESGFGLHAIFKKIIRVEKKIKKWQENNLSPITKEDQEIELATLNQLTNNIKANIINEFHSAIIKNQVEAVKKYINDYPILLNSLNICTQISPHYIRVNFPLVTPLHLAVINGCNDIINYLLNFDDINVNAKAYYCHRDPKINLTPISYAIEYSIIKVLEPLLQRKEIEVNLNDFCSLFNILREMKKENDIKQMINLIYICEIKLINSRIRQRENIGEKHSAVGLMFGINKASKIQALKFILANLESKDGILTIKDTPCYEQVKRALNQGETKKIFEAIHAAEVYIEQIKPSFSTINYSASCIMDKYG